MLKWKGRSVNGAVGWLFVCVCVKAVCFSLVLLLFMLLVFVWGGRRNAFLSRCYAVVCTERSPERVQQQPPKGDISTFRSGIALVIFFFVFFSLVSFVFHERTDHVGWDGCGDSFFLAA